MASQRVKKYNLFWEPLYDPVRVEMDVIRNGGQWQKKNGETAGEGLFFHYRRLQELLWPEDDHHRWSDLILSEILNNTITAILGPKDSGKTRCASKYALTDYFCFPSETMILISSTDIRGLELRVWGDLKSMFQRAKEKYDWLPGHMIDSKHSICTDNLREDEVRDMRKGIVCIPCMTSGGAFIGLGKFQGIKQKRRRHIGDEMALMRPAMMESIPNMNSGDFKGVYVGNPIGQGDPLDKVSEPKDGWGTEGEITRTTVWENRFIKGRTINLVGTDCPNFDFPQDQPIHFPYLINQKSIDAVSAFYGKDSLQYYSQCLGIRKPGLNARRVITRHLCEQHHALEPAVWLGEDTTRIAAVDAAYGAIGGDRCVGGHVEFGKDVNSQIILTVHPPVVIPVSVMKGETPEDQIARFMKEYCEQNGIPAENLFYDSTGRGALGTSFARIWSPYVNPVEFGGKATDRPVTADHFIFDRTTNTQRLKRCDEHYSKFVTELWWSVRYIIESGQMRNLPESVMEEGCMREWKMVRGDKIEIETKDDMKERMGRSPDEFDWLATACEGARRLGFSIRKMAGPDKQRNSFQSALDSLRKGREKELAETELTMNG